MTRLVASDYEFTPVELTEAWLEFAHGTLPNKADPGTAHIDGVPVNHHNDGPFWEFATPPMETGEEVVSLLLSCQEWVRSHSPFEVAPLWGTALPSWVVEGHHPIAELGCSPDFEASPDGTVFRRRRVPREVASSLSREAGMHIHVDLPEWALGEPLLIAGFVHELDAELYHMQQGLQLAGIEGWYRRPRIFRQKPYGIEYRSLSAQMLLYPEAAADAFNYAIDLSSETFK